MIKSGSKQLKNSFIPLLQADSLSAQKMFNINLL